MCFVMEISYQNLIVLEVSLGNATQPLSLSRVCVCVSLGGHGAWGERGHSALRRGWGWKGLEDASLCVIRVTIPPD
jgi:hypothetical protein